MFDESREYSSAVLNFTEAIDWWYVKKCLCIFSITGGRQPSIELIGSSVVAYTITRTSLNLTLRSMVHRNLPQCTPLGSGAAQCAQPPLEICLKVSY